MCRATFIKLSHWTILAAIAMPDHLHLLASPVADRDASVSAFAKWFKRWFNDAYWARIASAPVDEYKSWRWQEAVLIGFSDPMSHCRKNGNMCDRILCARASSKMPMSGRISFNSTNEASGTDALQFIVSCYGLISPVYQRTSASPKNIQVSAPNAR